MFIALAKNLNFQIEFFYSLFEAWALNSNARRVAVSWCWHGQMRIKYHVVYHALLSCPFSYRESADGYPPCVALNSFWYIFQILKLLPKFPFKNYYNLDSLWIMLPERTLWTCGKPLFKLMITFGWSKTYIYQELLQNFGRKFICKIWVKVGARNSPLFLKKFQGLIFQDGL